MNTLNTCPNSDNGIHRYFFNKMITEFVPVNTPIYDISNTIYYEKQEYALSACACGRALKERINYEA